MNRKEFRETIGLMTVAFLFILVNILGVFLVFWDQLT